MITEGKKVNISYSIYHVNTLENITHQSEEIEFIQGNNEIIPAIEAAIEGLSIGDTTSITLAPKDSFGPIEEDYFQIIDIAKIPPDLRFINAEIIIEDEKGEKSSGRIAKINANQIIIDLNHPLAGKTLTYNIEIINISDGYPVH